MTNIAKQRSSRIPLALGMMLVAVIGFSAAFGMVRLTVPQAVLSASGAASASHPRPQLAGSGGQATAVPTDDGSVAPQPAVPSSDEPPATEADTPAAPVAPPAAPADSSVDTSPPVITQATVSQFTVSTSSQTRADFLVYATDDVGVDYIAINFWGVDYDWGTMHPNGDGTWWWSYTPLPGTPAGTLTFEIMAVDVQGNSNTTYFDVYVVP